jgi:hypothetical protein
MFDACLSGLLTKRSLRTLKAHHDGRHFLNLVLFRVPFRAPQEEKEKEDDEENECHATG